MEVLADWGWRGCAIACQWLGYWVNGAKLFALEGLLEGLLRERGDSSKIDLVGEGGDKEIISLCATIVLHLCYGEIFKET